MELASRLAEYALSVRHSDIQGRAESEMKARLIDALGCAIASRNEKPVRIAKSAVALGSESTAIGGGKYSREHATFLNGLMIRYFDYNDTYLSKEPAHPSDNIAPCLAVAEAEESAGTELLTSAVVAYELQCRLCDAADLRHRGWDHVNYGLVSATLAACRLMGMDVKRSTQALNIALNGHIAMRQVRAGELSMWKGASFANAARNSVFAAVLAREGMTGPAPIFEGEMGFFRQVSGPFRVNVQGFGGRGGGFRVLDTYVKYWPVEYHAQTAVWAALEARKSIGSPAKVKSVQVMTHEAGFTILGKDKEKWSPGTRETADHSLPFIVASSLANGGIGVESFAESSLGDRKIRSLIRKVVVSEDPSLSAMYPAKGMPNRVVIRLNSGKTLSSQVDVPRGHPANPMTRKDIEAKFFRLAVPQLGMARAKEALKRLWRLESEKRPEEVVALLND